MRRSESVKPVALAATGISKRFGQAQVLKDVSLTLREGEVVSIVGPSGSGKSTFLRCINYLEQPDTGTVTVGDFSIAAGSKISRKDLHTLRERLGMVFQSFNLFPHMTALRNVSLAQERVLGRSRKDADEVSLGLLKRVGLVEKANAHPSRCSGGQQQRIAIARALALNPKIMLFDEPTSSLDPELGAEVLKVMRELAEGGMTMVVVTHEMSFAENVADRTIIMADGSILEEGPSSDVIRDPSTERARRFMRAVTHES
jgi:polar amino acid transport system ATP-binding protein